MVCFILLMATFLNYANRFAFTQNSAAVQHEFETDKEGYGQVAGNFGLGFACGALLFGFLADRVSVRLLYPAVLILWSLAGFWSGMASSLDELAYTRFVLGLFEAGHWPCALRTTQRTFSPAQRTWGNSILQSGASLGAVATPLLVVGLYAWDPGQWRLAFFIVGGLGIPWVFWWLWTVRESDVRRPVIQTDEHHQGAGKEQTFEEIPYRRLIEEPSFGAATVNYLAHISRVLFWNRRWWVLLAVVVMINTLWHYIRVWLPDTLEGDHKYSHEFVQYFTSLYFLATFFGSLTAGWLAAVLPRRGWNVHRARLAVFLVFGLLSTMSIPAAFAPRGPLLLGLLLVVAFGSLGLFPIYYSLNQEISAKNQGIVGGSLGFTTWAILYWIHPLVGRLVDQQPTIRPYLFAVVGLGPLIAFFVLLLFWGKRPPAKQLGKKDA